MGRSTPPDWREVLPTPEGILIVVCCCLLVVLTSIFICIQCKGYLRQRRRKQQSAAKVPGRGAGPAPPRADDEEAGPPPDQVPSHLRQHDARTMAPAVPMSRSERDQGARYRAQSTGEGRGSRRPSTPAAPQNVAPAPRGACMAYDEAEVPPPSSALRPSAAPTTAQPRAPGAVLFSPSDGPSRPGPTCALTTEEPAAYSHVDGADVVVFTIEPEPERGPQGGGEALPASEGSGERHPLREGGAGLAHFEVQGGSGPRPLGNVA